MKDLFTYGLIAGVLFLLFKDQIMDVLRIKEGECAPGEHWVAGDWGLPGSCQRPLGPFLVKGEWFMNLPYGERRPL